MKRKDDTKKRKTLRSWAEKRLRECPEDAEDISFLSPEGSKNLVHELRVHQVELEMQNEQLRESEGELEKARDMYSNLYDFSPVGYFTIGEKGMIEEANLTGASVLGVERGRLIGMPFTRFILKDDQDIFYSHRQRLLEIERPQSCELRLLKKDGHEFYAHLECIVVKDSDGNFNQIRAAVNDITERKKAEEQIKASLREKEILLKEIHHRVKNNLEVISSLLDMTSMRTDNQQAADLFGEARNRIHMMGLIHSQLYESDRLDQIDMVRFVRQLMSYLSEVYTARARSIIPVIESSDIYLSVTQAIPCALVLNELICNALKHAFKEGQKGTIEVQMQRSADNTVCIRVKDDGVGMPEEIDIYKAHGLGLKLVRNLIQHQLKGKIEVERNNGTEIVIGFKASEEGAKHA